MKKYEQNPKIVIGKSTKKMLNELRFNGDKTKTYDKVINDLLAKSRELEGDKKNE